MLKNTFNTNIDSGLCGLFKIALVHRNFVNDIIVLEIYVLICNYRIYKRNSSDFRRIFHPSYCQICCQSHIGISWYRYCIYIYIQQLPTYAV